MGFSSWFFIRSSFWLRHNGLDKVLLQLVKRYWSIKDKIIFKPVSEKEEVCIRYFWLLKAGMKKQSVRHSRFAVFTNPCKCNVTINKDWKSSSTFTHLHYLHKPGFCIFTFLAVGIKFSMKVFLSQVGDFSASSEIIV